MADDQLEFVQDPMFPTDWWPWMTGDGVWHARPPGFPNPLSYVHGETKQVCADRAWYEYRKMTD